MSIVEVEENAVFVAFSRLSWSQLRNEKNTFSDEFIKNNSAGRQALLCYYNSYVVNMYYPFDKLSR